MNDRPVVGVCRFRYPGQPWGPSFVWRSINRRVVRTSLHGVKVGVMRTNHRYCCWKCKHEFLGGPGSLSGHKGCLKCGHVYWDWLTWPEVKHD